MDTQKCGSTVRKEATKEQIGVGDRKINEFKKIYIKFRKTELRKTFLISGEIEIKENETAA